MLKESLAAGRISWLPVLAGLTFLPSYSAGPIHGTKVFAKDKEVTNISLDPNLETADVRLENNHFPKRAVESKFDKYKGNN